MLLHHPGKFGYILLGVRAIVPHQISPYYNQAAIPPIL